MVGGSGWGGAVGRPRIVCYSQGGWCYSQGTARVGSATARVGSGIGWVMGFSCQGQGFVCYRSEGQAPRPLPLPPPPASCPLQKDSAQALYEEARRRWVEDYEERLAEWEGMHTQLESQRDEAQAALPAHTDNCLLTVFPISNVPGLEARADGGAGGRRPFR